MSTQTVAHLGGLSQTKPLPSSPGGLSSYYTGTSVYAWLPVDNLLIPNYSIYLKAETIVSGT